MTLNPDQKSEPKKYWAFISYRHADNKAQDRDWASWLHQEIERYEVPGELIGTTNQRGDTIPERIYPVFRDEDSLPADADLAHSISNALDNSRFLVALCSPRAVESQYVAQEIDHFKATNKGDRIIAALIAGEPGDPENECFPNPLSEIVTPDGKLAEPIAADFRLPDGSEGFTSAEAYKKELLKTLPKKEALKKAEKYDEHLQLMKLKIIAGILGLPLETVRDRDKAYQLQKAKKHQKIFTTVSLLAIAALFGGLLAWKNQKKAEQQTHRAEEQTALTLEEQKKQKKLLWQASEADCESGIAARDAGRRDEALAYFQRGLKYEPENPRNALQALETSLLNNERCFTRFHRKLSAPILTISSSPEKSQFLVSSEDKTIRLFDFTGDQIWKINLKENVTILEFSPDGSKIAAAAGNTFFLFDNKGNKLWKRDLNQIWNILSLAFSPNSSHIAVGLEHGSLFLLSIENSKIWELVEKIPQNINHIIFSPDGLNIIVGSHSFTSSFIYLFDILGEKNWEKEFSDCQLTRIISSPDGTRIAAILSPSLFKKHSEKAVILDINGNEYWRIELGGIKSSLSFSIEGSRIAIGSYKSLQIFDLNGTEIWKKALPEQITIVKFSPNGAHIAAASNGGTFHIFDFSGKEIWKSKLNETVDNFSFSHNGSQIIAASKDYSLILFNLLKNNFPKFWETKLHTDNFGLSPINTLGSTDTYKEFSPKIIFSKNGGFAAVSSHKKLHLFNTGSEGKLLWEINLDWDIYSFCFSPNDSKIITGSNFGILCLFDNKGNKIWRENLDRKIEKTSYSPDGQKIAVITQNYSRSENKSHFLHLFDIKGKELWRTNIDQTANSLNFSPASNRIIIAQENLEQTESSKIRFFDFNGNESPATKINNQIDQLCISPTQLNFTISSQKSINDSHIHNFDFEGNERWKKKISGAVNSFSYSATENKIAISYSRIQYRNIINSIILLDLNGNEIWRTNIEGYNKIKNIANPSKNTLLVSGHSEHYVSLFNLSKILSFNKSNTPRLSAWITQTSSKIISEDGRFISPSKKDINNSQKIISNFLKSSDSSALHGLLKWRISDSILECPASNELSRLFTSKHLTESYNEETIISLQEQAPWHPLVPVSLAKLKRNSDNPERKKFLCRLTLTRLQAANSNLWGKDHLAEDAAFAAETMISLGYPKLAKETAQLALSFNPENKKN